MENNQDFKLACDALDIFNMESMVFTTPKLNSKVGEQINGKIPFGNNKHSKPEIIEIIINVDKNGEMVDENTYLEKKTKINNNLKK
jgi:hypothetical protein